MEACTLDSKKYSSNKVRLGTLKSLLIATDLKNPFGDKPKT